MVRFNGSPDEPAATASSGGSTAPRPVAKNVMVEPAVAGFVALTREPSALRNIPMPWPFDESVKIPGE